MSQKEINPQSASQAARWTTADKPDWMSSTSVCIISALIVHGADDHSLKISYVELGAMCGCHQDAAKRAMTKELIAHKWVTQASSKWSAHEFTLTAEYLKHLKTKVEVTQDAKDFASWFHGVQTKNLEEVKAKLRKSVGAKTYEFRDHNNAAKILDRVGGVNEAKTQTSFALSSPTYRHRALQGLYNLKAVLLSQSFKGAFTQTDAASVPVPLTNGETPHQTLDRLRAEVRAAMDTRKSIHIQFVHARGPEKPTFAQARDKQDTVVKAAKDALAEHAMVVMGIDPNSSWFPEEISYVEGFEYRKKWTEMKKAEAQEVVNV